MTLDKCGHGMLRRRTLCLALSTNLFLVLLSDVTFPLFPLHSSCLLYLDMGSFPTWDECLLRPFPNTVFFILRNWTLGFKVSGENEAHVELNIPLEHPYTSSWSGPSHFTSWGAVKEKQQCLREGAWSHTALDMSDEHSQSLGHN